jgi:hypothetical protein
VLLFDNEAVAPTGTGFIEVCKDAGYQNSDSAVLGVPFDFTITEADGSQQDVTVLGGQCTAPIVVAAGVVRVEEHDEPGYTLVDVYTIPEDRLLGENLINGTADVEVPTSSNPNDETQVHFVNERDRSQLKICKALGPGSLGLLPGDDEPPLVFRFEVSAGMTMLGYANVTAAESTQCVIFGDVPTGTTVTVRETNQLPDTSVSCSGSAPPLTPGSNTPGSITIGPGINTITCVNQAIGKLEICKRAIPGVDVPAANLPTFKFRIDGSASSIPVRANRCSPPQYVVPGEHTVSEDFDTNYELINMYVTPPEREVSRSLLARSIRVVVPWAALGETRVDFENRIRRAQIKVCKHIEAGSETSLGGLTFNYTLTSNNSAVTTPNGNIFFVAPDECQLLTTSGVPRDIPILTAVGGMMVPTTVTITEAAGPYTVASVTSQGTRTFNWTSGYSATFTLGPNTNTIHYTNRAVPA